MNADLENFGVLDGADGRLYPTLYGLMIFGKNPQGYPQTTGFYIQCSACECTDSASNTILAWDGKGRLEEQVNRALGWIESMGRTESYTGITRRIGH